MDNFEETIYGYKGAYYKLNVDFSISEKESALKIDISLSEENGEELCSVYLASKIFNPIFIDDVIIVASTKYAICVASGIVASATPLLHEVYEQSKDENIECCFLDRAKDVCSKFKKRSRTLKYAITGSLTTCTLSLL